MIRRDVSVLAAGGVACLGLSILTGGPLTGYSIVSIPAILFRAGVIYLTLSVATAILSPIALRDALLSTLCATVLVFLSGSIAMYYDLVLTPPRYGTDLTTNLLVGTQAQGLLMTLPISVGYVAGVLVRSKRRYLAIGVILVAIFGGWFGGSQLALSMGSAPGFTQMFFALAIVASAALAILPITAIAGWDSLYESAVDIEEAI
jgi:hypothetical protein